jgi:hypothetical protein
MCVDGSAILSTSALPLHSLQELYYRVYDTLRSVSITREPVGVLSPVIISSVRFGAELSVLVFVSSDEYASRTPNSIAFRSHTLSP